MKNKINLTCHTNGKGHWSNLSKQVNCYKLEAIIQEDENDSKLREFGELRVYFYKKYWNVETDGLIYRDKLFIKELREWLRINFGLNKVQTSDLTYSEQGMQGDNYVSFDFGSKFYKVLDKLPVNRKSV